MTSDRIGEVLAGKYLIEAFLGAGSMGLVYAAQHCRTYERVAIKFLRRELIGDDEHRQRFVREARAVAQLRHPSIVRLLDLDEDSQWGLYMVLELLHGESLEEMLERERTLTLARTLTLLRPVMQALERAHSHGVIHRDVKPANIYLHRDAEGVVAPKLLDFGLLRRLDLQRSLITKSGQTLGTVEQMSPEQAWGSKTLGYTTDVWAMAVVVYRCLSGVYPFVQSTHEATLVAIAQGEFMPLEQRCPELPRAADIQQVLARALRVDVASRTPSMSMLVRELESLSEERSPAPAAEREHEPIRTVPSRRARRRRLGIVAGLLGLVGAGTWLGLSRCRHAGSTTSRNETATTEIFNAAATQPEPLRSPPLPPEPIAIVDAGGPAPKPRARPKRPRPAMSRTTQADPNALELGDILVH